MDSKNITPMAYYQPGPATQTQHQPQPHQQPQGYTVVAVDNVPAGYRWSWCTFVAAMFSAFCCQPLGFISMIMGLLAYTDHKAKDYKRSHTKAQVACGLAVAAIMFGVVIVICVAAVMATQMDRYQSYYYGK